MNLLLDALPTCVMIGGAEYPIRWDFRTSILFELLMQDDTIADEDKMRKALDLYFYNPPPDVLAASEAIIWFYACGKPDQEKAAAGQSDDAEETASSDRVYSFADDDDYIYAAFMQQYGIDLNAVEGLHWWTFRAMFRALDEKCEFVKIMGYRSVKITSKMSKEQQHFYRRMKSLYALPISKSEQEKHNAIVDALMHGGDLSGLL